MKYLVEREPRAKGDIEYRYLRIWSRKQIPDCGTGAKKNGAPCPNLSIPAPHNKTRCKNPNPIVRCMLHAVPFADVECLYFTRYGYCYRCVRVRIGQDQEKGTQPALILNDANWSTVLVLVHLHSNCTLKLVSWLVAGD